MTARDRSYIRRFDMGDLLKESDQFLKEWIATKEELIKKGTKDAEKQTTAHAPKITEFFSSVPKP